MHLVSANGKERFKALLFLLKSYALFGPFIVLALLHGTGIDGSAAMNLVTVSHVVTFVVLLFFGISQSSAGLRNSAYSSFIYAGVALFWILVLLLLTPCLA
jgi:hypothetical protein